MRHTRYQPKIRDVALISGVTLIVTLLAGCGSGKPKAVRPSVRSTAVSAAGIGARQEAEFFDRLAGKSDVSHDDAVHAVLLLATGDSASTFEERVRLAKELQLVDRRFNRPAREVTTYGEISLMFDRLIFQRADRSQIDATEYMRSVGLIPVPVEADQGLTGMQFLSVLGRAEDLLGPVPTVELPYGYGSAENTPIDDRPIPDPPPQRDAEPGPEFYRETLRREREPMRVSRDPDPIVVERDLVPTPPPAREDPPEEPPAEPIEVEPEPERVQPVTPSRDREWVPGRPLEPAEPEEEP